MFSSWLGWADEFWGRTAQNEMPFLSYQGVHDSTMTYVGMLTLIMVREVSTGFLHCEVPVVPFLRSRFFGSKTLSPAHTQGGAGGIKLHLLRGKISTYKSLLDYVSLKSKISINSVTGIVQGWECEISDHMVVCGWRPAAPCCIILYGKGRHNIFWTKNGDTHFVLWTCGGKYTGDPQNNTVIFLVWGCGGESGKYHSDLQQGPSTVASTSAVVVWFTMMGKPIWGPGFANVWVAWHFISLKDSATSIRDFSENLP